MDALITGKERADVTFVQQSAYYLSDPTAPRRSWSLNKTSMRTVYQAVSSPLVLMLMPRPVMVK